MAQIDDRYAHADTAARTDAAADEGLRAYMVRVFNYMAGGVFLTGLVAYVTFSAAVVERAGPGRRSLTEFGQLLYNSPFKWAVMLAPLAFVLLPVVPRQQDECWCDADFFLAVRRGDGPVAVIDLLGLHRGVDHAGVLRDGGGVRRA